VILGADCAQVKTQTAALGFACGLVLVPRSDLIGWHLLGWLWRETAHCWQIWTR